MSVALKADRPKRKMNHKRFIPMYLMMLPGLLYLLINNYIPMGGIIIAFKHVNWNKGILASPFAGFSNFEYLFKTKEAWIITRNTIAYNIVFIILGTVLAVAVAILLNEIRSKFWKKLYQTIVLLPYLISMVIVSYLVFAMLSSEYGFVNHSIMEPLGFGDRSWYTEPNYWPYILTIVHIWKTFGYSCIIYYATLVGIDRGYYEAAVIDGANRWQQIVHITLPGLKATMITLVLLAIGTIFYSDFGLFYQVPMDSGPLYDVTNTIDTYVYRGLIKLNDIGMSSAAGLYQSLVGFILVFIANRIVVKYSKENALF
ncbi:ABC transporter permease [Paenibacillus ginsengarvi]|uniref:Sugar ABC transporter permease n=1 Tax=Paenibacillus ginsengarvi TaxID=400777 RepID=A0A3B0CKT0_9BACL|nr:ABC transporter permease subunit [Paenibacillus ginsengarvi]RKN84947.1 sugar ABC transporter permease [Paenibacillus ginsengarvi]